MGKVSVVLLRTVTVAALIGCRDDGPAPVPVPVPFGLVWGSGANGAMVQDTIRLVAFYTDSAGDPIGYPRPSATWRSSDTSIVRVLSDTLALALDTGRVTLVGRTAATFVDTVLVAFEVIPRWSGRLAWDRQVSPGGHSRIVVQQYPGHSIQHLPDLGYPGSDEGSPSLSSDGRYLAAIAPRTVAPAAAYTIYVVDLVTGAKTAPFDSLPGSHIAPVWFPGDTLLGFVSRAPVQYDVFTARPDGTDRQQRTNFQQPAPTLFDVTPDGNLVVRLEGPEGVDLFETTLNGQVVHRLTATPEEEGRPAVSPNGQHVVFSVEAHVWIMGRDGSNARRLLPNTKVLYGPGPPFFAPLPATSSTPSWSADGQFVLVGRSADAHWTAYDAQSDSLFVTLPEIYAVRWADGLAVRLTHRPQMDGDPVFR